MEALNIPASANTPRVEYTFSDQSLTIEGKVIPENVEDLFQPINKWLDAFFKSNAELNVVFRLYYYNTSSFKRLFNLCKKLNELALSGKKITVRWEYEEGDDDSKTDAEEILGAVSFPYQIVEVEG